MNNATTSSGTLHVGLSHRVTLVVVFSVVFLCGIGVGVTHGPRLSFEKTVRAASTGRQDLSKNHGTHGASYQITTYRQSYFKLDSSGAIVRHKTLPWRAEDTYHLDRTIDPEKTAIVIMDPWVDMAAEHLNEYYGQITESHVLPLVSKALDRGHPAIVLTNSPAAVTYNTNIHPGLEALAAQENLKILYHQNMGDDQFAAYLRNEGINALIYTGFASNMCVIGRPMGLISMVRHGFKLYFVPEASAAVEYPDTWETQSIHHATTKIISQWIAEIIDYDEFMDTTDRKS